MIDLAVVVPVYDERDNVAELVRRLGQALAGIEFEIIFVDDDSPDGTADVVRGLAEHEPRVRCLQRIGRRGLSRAVIEGLLSTAAPYMVVMDADLQHDEALVPQMLARARQEGLDIVIGSRYCAGGSVGQWDTKRAALSRLATWISRAVVKAPLTDPMSGFFLVRREAFHGAVRRLSGEGYKILLDLFASFPEAPRYAELPYTFRPRFKGESKLDSTVLLEYVLLLIDKTVGRFVPARFVLFCLVGASGLAVHFATLWALFRPAGIAFGAAQLVATVVAMTSNYALNNAITYRDRRRRGLRFVTGLLSFYAVCAVGVIGNVGVADFVFARDYTWWLAGGAGALVGTVWNYAASSLLTWQRR